MSKKERSQICATAIDETRNLATLYSWPWSVFISAAAYARLNLTSRTKERIVNEGGSVVGEIRLFVPFPIQKVLLEGIRLKALRISKINLLI